MQSNSLLTYRGIVNLLWYRHGTNLYRLSVPSQNCTHGVQERFLTRSAISYGTKAKGISWV